MYHSIGAADDQDVDIDLHLVTDVDAVEQSVNLESRKQKGEAKDNEHT